MAGGDISRDRRCRDSIFLIHLGAAMVTTEPCSDLPDAQPDNGDIVGGCDAGRSGYAGIDRWADVRYRRNLRRQLARTINVRFWPKADIPDCTAHVRFRG